MVKKCSVTDKTDFLIRLGNKAITKQHPGHFEGYNLDQEHKTVNEFYKSCTQTIFRTTQ